MKRTREGFAEHLRNLFALSLAHEAVIHIYAGEPVSNGLVDQRRGHRRVHTAGQRQQHRARFPHGFPNVPHRGLRISLHGPVAGATANIPQEGMQQHLAFLGMGYLGMELHAIKMFFRVGHGRHRTVFRMGNGMEARRANLHLVGMAHPVAGGFTHALEQVLPVVHGHTDAAVFPLGCFLHGTTQQMRRQLHAIANAQYRHTQFPNAQIAPGCVLFQYTGRSAAQNNPLGPDGAYLFHRGVIGQYFGINLALPNPPGNQLRILAAKVQNHNFLRFPP